MKDKFKEFKEFGSQGGKSRWSKVSKKERSKIMQKVSLQRFSKDTQIITGDIGSGMKPIKAKFIIKKK